MSIKELTGGTVTISAFYTAMLAAFWAYQGWVSVGFIGGEVKDPTKNIPKGIVIRCFYCDIYLSAGKCDIPDSLINSATCCILMNQVIRLLQLRQSGLSGEQEE